MIKLYTITWTLKDTFWDELKDVSTFSSQENWWNWKLTLSLKYGKDLPTFEVWDVIKYYNWSDLIYSWNILEIEQEENVAFNFIKLNVIWLAHFTANFTLTQVYSDTLENIVIDLIAKYNIERWQTILSLWSLVSDSWIYSIDIWEKSYLDYFRELSTKSWFKFYISDTWEVNFWVWNDVSLTFAWDVEAIRNIKTSEIISSNKIFNSIWIIVNNKYDYYWIKPLDKIKIKNNNKYKEIYTVAKVDYWIEKATIELENFISFTKLLWN